MRNLLSANFSRLWKNKLFYFALGCMLLLSIVGMFNGCRQASMDAMSEYTYHLEDFYFNLAPLVGLFSAVFIGLFLGTEYSDGTLRNKLIVGHTRLDIYLANFLTCTAASLLFVAAWLIGGLVGVPTLGLWQMTPSKLFSYLAICLLFNTVFAAIFTLIGMLFSNKATGAVVSILFFLALLVGASMIYNALSEQEFISGVVITLEGMHMGEPTLNPNYIRGVLRTVYETILNILPTGQAILMANLDITRPLFQMTASLFLILLICACGALLFSKKDLK